MTELQLQSAICVQKSGGESFTGFPTVFAYHSIGIWFLREVEPGLNQCYLPLRD